MISAQALVEKFEYALNDHWGYIWGSAGIMWTAAKQQQKVDYMVSKYGANWQKNADAKNDNYYSAALYGAKWIGHTVADCSGLFACAFKQLGGAIAHGSNSIYDSYCGDKGKLDSSLKQRLVPGVAVFTSTTTNGKVKHNHIGLYVGNGKVIEAQGTQAGVCVSNITASKWTYYGYMKGVSYSYTVPASPNVTAGTTQQSKTLRKGDKGEAVKELQNKLLAKGYKLPRYGADGDFGNETLEAVKQFQRDHGLAVDGIAGEKTLSALDGAEKVVLYTVTVKGVVKAVGDEIISKYGGTLTKEG